MLVLMLDGKWHSNREAYVVCGQLDGMRRLRELGEKYSMWKAWSKALRCQVYKLKHS